MQLLGKSSLLGTDEEVEDWGAFLRVAKDAECSDTRDRVLGMLSLDHKWLRIKVDYSATTCEIVEQVFKVLYDWYQFYLANPWSRDKECDVGEEDFRTYLGRTLELPGGYFSGLQEYSGSKCCSKSRTASGYGMSKR